MLSMSLGQGHTLEISCTGGRLFSFHFDSRGAPIGIRIQRHAGPDIQVDIVHKLRGKRLPWRAATTYEHDAVAFQDKLQYALHLAAGV